MNHKERIINALYAQAVADAVGDPFEFKSNIFPSQVSRYAGEAKTLSITDDTQMALFGFEAMNAIKMGIKPDFAFKKAYLSWYHTQTKKPDFLPMGGLMQFKSLYELRAPGNTCLQALSEVGYHGKRQPNDSKGCGSVMRLLPIALDIPNALQNGLLSADITHGHIENAEAVRLYVHMLAHIDLRTPIMTDPNIKSIEHYGAGWTALSCVQMAIWAYLKANDFNELLQLSISHDGDSDSVAAVAGSLWGYAGREVPQNLIDKLVEKDAIDYVIENYIKSY